MVECPWGIPAHISIPYLSTEQNTEPLTPNARVTTSSTSSRIPPAFFPGPVGANSPKEGP